MQSSRAVYWKAFCPAIFTTLTSTWTESPGCGFSKSVSWRGFGVRARPRAKMVVVGHSPPKALIQAARDRRLAWTFTGFVDDIRPYVRDAHVYVIPLRVGGGTRIKAYEAMAMGRPVVSTTVGAEGLPVIPERDLLVADTDEAFAAAVLRLLDDSATRRGLAASARFLVEQRYSANVAAGVFEEACCRAITLAERAVT